MIFNLVFANVITENFLVSDCKSLHTEFQSFGHCMENRSENICALNLACLNPDLFKFHTQTFTQPGPNCFSTALKTAQIYPSFRAVSAREFSEATEKFCTESSEPKPGDLGVYFVEGFGPVHAFLYLSKSIGFEKPGVDYLGQTPLRFNLLSNIDYTHRASKECLIYGDSSCFNRLKFFTCEKAHFSKKFEENLNLINSLIDSALVKSAVSSDELLKINSRLKNLKSTLNNSSLENEVVKSIETQIKFFN